MADRGNNTEDSDIEINKEIDELLQSSSGPGPILRSGSVSKIPTQLKFQSQLKETPKAYTAATGMKRSYTDKQNTGDRYDETKSPAAKLKRIIDDTSNTHKMAKMTVDSLEQSERYKAANKTVKSDLKRNAIMKRNETTAEAVESLMEITRYQTELTGEVEASQEKALEGNRRNNVAVNRNHRDGVVIYKTLDAQMKRKNENCVKVGGLECLYIYDDEIGTKWWAKKGDQLLKDMNIPENVKAKDTGLVQWEWGMENEQIVWSKEGKKSCKKTVENQKKTHLIATFSNFYIPKWLTSKDGLDRVKELKKDTSTPKYSNFLSISELLGPGGELMSQFVQDTRRSMIYQQKNNLSAFPELGDVDRIFTDGAYRHIMKIHLKPNGAVRKQVIRVPYDDLQDHPLTRKHTPSFNKDKSRKKPQPINVSGRAGVLRQRTYDMVDGVDSNFDTELMETQLALGNNSTPFVFKPQSIPSHASERVKRLLEGYNENAKLKFQIEQEKRKPPEISPQPKETDSHAMDEDNTNVASSSGGAASSVHLNQDADLD